MYLYKDNCENKVTKEIDMVKTALSVLIKIRKDWHIEKQQLPIEKYLLSLELL